MEKVIGNRETMLRYLIDHKEDIKYELSEHKEHRSLKANAYFHVLCNELAHKLGKPMQEVKCELNMNYGTIATSEDGKKMGCMIPKYVDIKKFYEYAYCYKEDEEHAYYLFFKRTSELNSLEFSKLLNGTVEECKQQGITTLDEIELKRLIDEVDNSEK